MKSNPAALTLMTLFRTSDNLLAAYNPGRQLRLTENQRSAYLGKAPSLGLVSKAFSPAVAESWISIELWDLAEFSGCKTKMTEKQIDELSQIILNDYGYMKLTELMDFFRRFKSGQYGKFYGAVDPMVITCALRDFARERIAILKHFERLAEEERKRVDPHEVSIRRAYAREDTMLRFYAANFGYSKDFTQDDFREIWWLFNMGYERKDHGYKDRK